MWVRLDDSFADDPRVLRAGSEAAWLHVRGLCYSARHLTDGRIPREFLVGHRGGAPLARKLVEVGLWQESMDGYVIADYLAWNPPASGVKEKRAKDAERKRNLKGFSVESERDPPSPSRPVPVPSRKDRDLTTSLAPTPSTDGPFPTPEEAKTQIRQFIGKTAQDKAMPSS